MSVTVPEGAEGISWPLEIWPLTTAIVSPEVRRIPSTALTGHDVPTIVLVDGLKVPVILTRRPYWAMTSARLGALFHVMTG